MTKVTINPGVCGFTTTVEAVSEDGLEVRLHVQTACPSFTKMFEDLGEDFDAMALCLTKPGTGPLFQYAQTSNFPIHNACAVFSGILKAVEAECQLALPRDTSTTFEKA
ncbi:MAG: hypothetical protein FWC59_03955 [Actinomycetia bacterium]|nr:hypothetical protein [Actinomycetes bacterium]